MRPEDRERERTCFRLLRQFGPGPVVVGGYAVSAYGPPRFSVDLDLVVSPREAQAVRARHRSEGFRKEKGWDGGGVLAGRSERWVLGHAGRAVSVDLLIGGISDRRTGASFSLSEIRAGSEVRPVRGLDPASTADVRVPSREVLVALKLTSGRRVDLRDVAVLSAGPVDVEEVSAALSRLPTAVVAGRATELLEAADTSAFRDSLKGVYVLGDREFEASRDGALALGAALLARFGRADK